MGKKYLNYKAKNSSVKPDDVATLIPDAVFKVLNENEPFMCVEEIHAPVEGTGGIYTLDFFKSFLEKMKNGAIPGDKLGHRDLPVSDFYTIGGAIKNEKDGEGDVLFKLLIPQTGYSDSNSGLIRDIKINNAEFSLVTEPEAKNENGKQYFVASLGSERNDRVGEGAMKQTVTYNSEQEKELLDLAMRNFVCNEKSDALVVNGKLNRFAVLQMQSNGNGKLAAKLLNAIKKSERSKNKMEKEELLKEIKASDLTIEECATALKATGDLRTDNDDAALKVKAAIVKLLADAGIIQDGASPEDVIKAATDVLKASEEAAEAIAENAVSELVKSKKVRNEKGEEVDNPAYLHAKEKVKNKRGPELKKAIEALKSDPIMNALRGQYAAGVAVVSGSGKSEEKSIWEAE